MAWLVGIIIRLLVPLTILKFPFYGSLAASLADNFDVFIWDMLGAQNLSENYNFIEKALDNYFYIIQGIVMFSWKNKIAKKTGFILLVYRTVGFILYEITKIRAMLFFFPNIFVLYFIVYLGIKMYSKKDPIKTNKDALLLVSILAVPKLIQEYIFHVAQINIYRLILSLL